MVALPAFYATRPIKTGQRRTKAEMQRFYGDVLGVAHEHALATVRQLFYQCEVRQLVEKAETGYSKVQRALMWLRDKKSLPWEAIVDSTRWVRKPRSYNRMEDLLESAASGYRKAVWAELPTRIEIWLEKDALAGVVYPVTEHYDVPLMVTRGYSSATYVRAAAQEIAADWEHSIQTWIYHLGDYDPSGQDAARDIREELVEFAPENSFWFEQIGVTPGQIKAFDLPTRPSKKSDSRSKGFCAESVELDAIPPDALRQLVRERIEAHLPKGFMDHLRQIEAEERRGFSRILDALRDSS